MTKKQKQTQNKPKKNKTITTPRSLQQTHRTEQKQPKKTQ